MFPYAPGFILMLKIWLFGKIVGCSYAIAHEYLTGRYRSSEAIDDIIREQILVQAEANVLADEQRWQVECK